MYIWCVAMPTKLEKERKKRTNPNANDAGVVTVWHTAYPMHRNGGGGGGGGGIVSMQPPLESENGDEINGTSLLHKNIKMNE